MIFPRWVQHFISSFALFYLNNMYTVYIIVASSGKPKYKKDVYTINEMNSDHGYLKYDIKNVNL